MKQLKLASGIMTVLLALSLIGAALHIYCSFDGQG